jgi:hypothetical protein
MRPCTDVPHVFMFMLSSMFHVLPIPGECTAVCHVPHLDDAVGNTLPFAERRQPHDELERVDIVRNDHELRLATLNELRHMVETILDAHRLLLLHLLLGHTEVRCGCAV